MVSPLAKADQIEALARRGAPFSLVVADVRSGRAAQVQVTPQPRHRQFDDWSSGGPRHHTGGAASTRGARCFRRVRILGVAYGAQGHSRDTGQPG